MSIQIYILFMHVCRYERRDVHKIDRYIDGNQIDVVSRKETGNKEKEREKACTYII